MENFEYQCQTKIIFGKETENQAGEEINKLGKKVLLHYGSGSIKKSGLYDRIVESLKKANVEFVELSGVVPNPRLSLVKEGVELCKKEDVDCILAVGGGSVIDSAKAIGAGAVYDGNVWDFFEGKIIEKSLPVGVVLTISAAGSEASNATVITNEDGPRKASSHGNIRPKFAILNPELTYSVSKDQTANGIADMMAHIFERYFTNSKSVDLTDKLCEGALRSIVKNGRIVMSEPENYDARANLMWASTLAHNGLLGTGREEDWASHGIEHQLSAFYDIPHGAGLAIIFPAWMRYVVKQDISRFAQFAREVWKIDECCDEDMAIQAIEKTKEFFKELGLPTSLSELNIYNEKFVEMAKICAGSGRRGNFVRLKSEDIERIYELAK
ncbi:iron-containing alcohol dehydrogenase [Candidatus Micrarchaeota archaeon]|nr:iron-containing alcohol dehydrogenase [Candidatus Micrarchaeota archaeon]MBU1681833.1 iron-containing alcohol dehydrogenase [Candidatus Micrarchaeota archaeon]